MGHGLVRHGSLKEEYFFPPSMPELALSLQRSVSEAALRGPNSARASARGLGSTPKGGGTPKGMMPPTGEAHGSMRAEAMSPAYRNFRNQLIPDPMQQQTTAVGGASTFGRGGF